MSKRKPMNAMERAVWEDAEGSLFVPEHLGKTERRPALLTSQLDRDIQLDYCAGSRKMLCGDGKSEKNREGAEGLYL